MRCTKLVFPSGDSTGNLRARLIFFGQGRSASPPPPAGSRPVTAQPSPARLSFFSCSLACSSSAYFLSGQIQSPSLTRKFLVDISGARSGQTLLCPLSTTDRKEAERRPEDPRTLALTDLSSVMPVPHGARSLFLARALVASGVSFEIV